MPAARRQWREFVDQTLKVLAGSPGGFGSLESLAAAVAPQMGWTCGQRGRMSVAKAQSRALGLLSNPNITAAIAEAFEAEAAFSVGDAMRQHVAWITGAVEHGGQRLPPSYQALKDYEALTIPKPAKNVHVQSESLVARVSVRDEAPQIRPRVIEAVVSRETPDA